MRDEQGEIAGRGKLRPARRVVARMSLGGRYPDHSLRKFTIQIEENHHGEHGEGNNLYYRSPDSGHGGDGGSERTWDYPWDSYGRHWICHARGYGQGGERRHGDRNFHRYHGRRPV